MAVRPLRWVCDGRVPGPPPLPSPPLHSLAMPTDHADTLDLARVTQECWIERVHFFERIDSTNNAALAHAARQATSMPELFIAEQQTGGRGRGGNQWWSSQGALTWSVLTGTLGVPLQTLPRVSLTMGLAIAEAVEQFATGDVTLKWPNDVFLNDRKVAGILLELTARAEPRLVIGVGLNVNNSIHHAPAELRQSATSLVDQRQPPAPLDRTAVLLACLQSIERCLDRFLAADASLPDAWRARSLLSGRQVRVATPRATLEGLCEGIADDGGLVVATPQGSQVVYGGVIEAFGPRPAGPPI